MAPLTKESVTAYILTRLGHPVIPVELDSTQLDQAIEEATLQYSRIKPQLKYDQFRTSAGVKVYLIPENKRGRGIIRCAIPPSKYRFGLGWGFGDEFSVFDSSVVQDLGHYQTAISYYQQARKVLSAHFEWRYILERGEVEISPPPQEALTVSYVYVDNVALGEVPDRDADWVKRYALEEAREMLGEIREMLGSIQGNQTSVQLNGSSLKSTAQERKKEYLQELKDRVGDQFYLPQRDS